MRSLAGRIKRLNLKLGNCETCPASGKPLDEKRLWQQGLMLRVVMFDEPDPPQCERCGKPRIIRITSPGLEADGGEAYRRHREMLDGSVPP
jgi:hypothetical protein